MRRSAGILVYRIKNQIVEVFLEHMGGPYWQNKENGAWSIPKGEYVKERALDAALREFQEETGFVLQEDDLKFLCSIKQHSQKLVTAFVACHDFDETLIKSNSFEIEWPPKSGKKQSFLEMDRAAWFSLEEAKIKILQGQVPFLHKLEEMLYESKQNYMFYNNEK